MACGLYLITCTDMLLHDPFRTMQCQNNGVLYVKRESIRFFVWTISCDRIDSRTRTINNASHASGKQ